MRSLLFACVALLSPLAALADEPGSAPRTVGSPTGETPAQVSPERARANFARPIVLGPDDVRVIPAPPAGFNAPREGIPHGRVERLAYASKVTGTTRHANVYLPPGYSPDRRYPVLYLLHGIAGDENEWIGYVQALDVLDNLYADGAVQPMIVVFANGRALPDDRATKNPFTPQNAAGFAKFERDLFEFLIPAVDGKYPTLADCRHRAVAGLSMGGGQALDFGLAHPEAFAWIGAFSPAPNTKPPAELVPDPAALRGKLKLLYLSCGNRDGLINIAQGVHAYLKAHDVPHIWNVDDGTHDRPSWESNLYGFAQLLFLPASPPGAAPQVFFDDFSYTSTDELESRGWTIRTKPGWPGIKGATWRKEDVSLPIDPANPENRILRMTSSTDGTPAHTSQTQICQQRKFKEGTYAARVHFARGPATGPAGDVVVESCYTYSTVDIPRNPNYSECDFEYLPGGGWGQKGPALFVTTWGSADPLPDGTQDNVHNIIPGGEGGWHVLVLQVAGGHVRYFFDGKQIADHVGRYYPREVMSLNFNLWFTREGVGASRQIRSYEEEIDWVYFEKDAVLSPDQVALKVQALRKAGVSRQDTVDPSGLPCPCNN
jgi:enterochelin esterase-like enzyme